LTKVVTDHDASGFAARTGAGPCPHEGGRPAPLRAVHAPNFLALPPQIGASLVITTDQAGQLVMARDEGMERPFRASHAAVASAVRLGDRAD
jgi:hypothetical protein